MNKAKKVAGSSYLSSITYATPNLSELASLAGDSEVRPSNLGTVASLASSLLRHLQVVVVTMGEGGVMVVRRGSAADPLPLHNDQEEWQSGERVARSSARHYPSRPVERVASVNGAGDCLAAAFLAAALQGRPQDCAVGAGLQAAAACMAVGKAVPADLAEAAIDWESPAEGTDVPLLP